MIREFRFILVSLLVVLLSSAIAFGQETTGTIEITVKDAAGAVVPNAPLTIEGATAGFKRAVVADSEGFARVLQVPPGLYKITVGAVSGFVAKTVDQVSVGLGRTTSVPIEMSTTVGAVVDVTASDTTGLDLTDTKIQTTISSRVAELIPKGLNFSTVLKYSAATRPENRSGQFQIDGASGSENTFIIDGQEMTDILTGLLDRNANFPFSIIQETQVKSSGFEAEFGGATGGVINVVTKGGGNDFHGEVGMNWRESRFEPILGVGLSSYQSHPFWYPTRRDHYDERNPTVSVQGPILKDHVWFSVAYAPQIFHQNRVLNYTNPAVVTTPSTEHYFFTRRSEKTFARLDAQPLSKLHLTSTVLWSPEDNRGQIPSFTSEFTSAPPVLVTTQGAPPILSGDEYLNQTGGRINSINFTASGSYLITNNLIASARLGHYFFNNKLGTYGVGSVAVPRINCLASPFSPSPFPAGFGCQRGQNNGLLPAANSLYDATTRDQLDFDLTYTFGAFGSHELKGGYQKNEIGNKVLEIDRDTISLRSGTTGLALISGWGAQTSALPSTPGAIGSGQMQIFQTAGDVHSNNTGIYIQDKWQPTKRLTLNLGFRTEREDVPSYAEGLPGLKFSWGSKIAPRLGASYDLTGDGKTKISGFFGYFYDRFKLTLPRGSFGGDKFHQIYFEIFPTDNINTLNRDTILGVGVQPPDGGICPRTATQPVYGRVRCDIDQRINSNINVPGQDITEVGGVDPNLKPFRQREITFTFQRQLNDDYLFSSRYTRKEVQRTIEDVGFVNTDGQTVYLIGNPGEGLAKTLYAGQGLVAPKPQRQYDALEFRIDRRFKNNYFFSANYTFSRLYGNYGGLASSDEEGRADPNVERYFDEPTAGYTAAGGFDNGRLATDRPHVFKAFGAYRLNWDRFGLWSNNSTEFNFFYTISSGTLITSFVNIRGVEQIILTRRGDQGRTPVFSQTDFAVRHSIKFGREGRFTIKLDADIINLFNQYIVTNRGRNPSGQGGNIISTANFDVLDPQWGLITQPQLDACAANNNNKPCFIAALQNFQQNGAPLIVEATTNGYQRNLFYNLDSAYQGQRTVRYGIRFIF